MKKIADDIEVFVLTTSSKPATTFTMLDSVSMDYYRFVNTDHALPPDHPEWAEDRSNRENVRDYAVRQYRAFRGHQEILSRSVKPFTLVFEDDASLVSGVTAEDFVRTINAGRHLIHDAGYDAVSFHGRNLSKPIRSICSGGREFVELGIEEQTGGGHRNFLRPVVRNFDGRYADYMFRWHEGCLAYMVGQVGRDKWVNAGHGYGMPCDIFLANELYSAVLWRTIFLHDERHGSLMLEKV